MPKGKPDSKGFVYSTDPNFSFREEETPVETLVPAKQKLKVFLDTRNRSGKAVTLIDGFTGSATELDSLGKKLKSFCGTGGSVKDAQIIVQGDQREKVLKWLLTNGYTQTKISGR